jgi:hypothetical protein
VRGVRATAILLAGLTLAAADNGAPNAAVALGKGGAAQRQVPLGPSRRAPSASAFDPSDGVPGYDGGFHFCRVWFRQNPYGDGDGWYVDYPRADENLSIRLGELTKAPVAHDVEGNPFYSVVRLTDPALFQCPFVMMSEPGGSFFSSDEAAGLRAYLLKGGFLWADDFWGELAWSNWKEQISKALPPGEFPIVDLTTANPMFHTLFNIQTLPQIPNIGLWVRYRQTSERDRESAQMHARGIFDHNGRVMVFMTHNTDFGDAYEREAESPDYFKRFSVNGYAIGIDVLLYAMTH